ncbi:YciI family protein [Devosia sp. XK-2]|uniref:YciI family protein n=1 Tax=Devosia sp. XK-2 TaxID=3126689 RepID=UPI0030D07548
MPYFCVHAFDHPGRLADRQRLRDAHRARLRLHDHPVVVRIGGPLTDDNGAMIGSLLVIEAANRGDVAQFLAGDPYAEAGLYRELTVTRFNWGLGLPEAAHG